MTETTDRVLIAIPTLNEAAHIGDLLLSLIPFLKRSGGHLVVADGGSSDATRDIVRVMAKAEPSISLLENPARIQSAAVNLAVEQYGDSHDWLIRLDAHAEYPADYCDVLLSEAARTGADSVVVAMDAVGQGFGQQVIAAAQNSRFGNGGSAHRVAPKGKWIDHGHHALMRIAAFREVGGYDVNFGHNEDAELDHRLREAGFRIWLTGQTKMVYFPRRALGPLSRQYFNFGRGRARNLLKHRQRPGARQAVVAALSPALLLALLWPVHWAFALPLGFWLLGCMIAGVLIARSTKDPKALLSGFAAGTMHVAWSFGFWREVLAQRKPILRRGATA